MAEGSNDSENQPKGRLGIGRGKPLATSNEEVPPPTTTTTTTSNSGWGGNSSGWGDASAKWDQSEQKGFNNDNANGSGFRGQRDGFSGPRGGRGGGGGGGDNRSCYNCNQPGHIARDCTQPRAERGEGGSHRSSYHRGGGGGGFNGDRGRGGGFGGGGDRDRTGGFGERSRGGFNQDSGFRSSTQGEDGSLSVTVRDSSGPNEKPPFSTGQGNNGSFSSGGRNTTFENTNQQNAPSNRPSGFTSRGSGHNFGYRTDNSNFGERKPYSDSHDADGGDRPRPTEKYIPAAAPTTEDEIFGEVVERGVNILKYHNAHVQCTPEGKVTPIEIYEEANLPTEVLTNIRRANYADPTAIQRYTIPCIQQQHDLMACAQTGAGKTAAFLLPIISNILQYHQNDLEMRHNPPAPLCLVLSPTRELALQTRNEAIKFAFNTPIKACAAIGGQDMFATSDRMKDGCHILSATTGRLKDMVEKGRIHLGHVKYLVLDEADRMLHHDFEPDIIRLMELGLREKAERFTSMFSATFPADVQRLAKRFLRDDYVFLAVGAIGGANEDITQSIEEVTVSRKKDRLFELLTANLKNERCLIFVETKRSADYLGALLSQRNFMSTTMHGDRTQQQREEAVKDFTNGKCPILVATSVAARGLDFPLIGYVINYDLPDSSDFYIHRIGRTGRAGHLGKSISFFDPDRQSDRQIAPDLVQKLSEAGQEVPDFLRRYGDGNATTTSQYNAPNRERNIDMRSHGGPSRGGRGGRGGGGAPNAWGTSGGTSSAGAAQHEEWD